MKNKKTNIPCDLMSFMGAIKNHPDLVYRIFRGLEEMEISDASEYAEARLAYFFYP